MKKIVVGLLLLCSLQSSAQKDTSRIELPAPPDSTALGVPDGKSVSKEIGSEGGSILSDDGRIELIFSASALMETKNISIQPTTNNAPNGTGKAYWFEPSGIQFKKPVELIFHYSDEEAEECPADLMGLAIQDKSGKWNFINYEEWDSAGKKLKGFIHHFTGASNVYMLRLKPAKTQVFVKESTRIEILEFFQKFNISVEAIFNARQQNHWYVNGHEMGSASLGYLSIYEETINATRTMITHATYIAPQYLLQDGNPVTVSVKVKILSGKRKGQYRTMTCKILVYDAYRVSVSHTGEYRVAMGNEITDSASFIVWVYPSSIAIANIRNYPPFLTRSRRRGPCSFIIFTSGAEGSLHLTDGYRDFKMSHDNPPEVLFRFMSTYEKAIFRFSWVCPGMPPTPEQNLLAIPVAPEINFIANGNPQRINVNDNGTLYKLIINPHRPNSH